MADELQAWDAETKRLQDEIDVFLQKFDDIDLLLQRANVEVLYYFQRQTDYTNVDDFKAFLKTELEFYLHTFSMPRSEKRLIRGRIIDIEENYNKILYFGERNPIEERDKKSMPIKSLTKHDFIPSTAVTFLIRHIKIRFKSCAKKRSFSWDVPKPHFKNS